MTAAGVGHVQARTFHSLGREILGDVGLLRREIRTLIPNEWRHLAFRARQQAGADAAWIDPADAPALIADCKLGLLITDAEALEQCASDGGDKRTLATLYRLYEQRLAERGWRDFDDLVFRAVRSLRDDAALRRRWQQRFTRVLVDEFQDIEPAQERMVRVAAAPEDSLFTVGDEDQTLYAWRRASVERIVALDQAFPGLQRVALSTNYRCPSDVVARSARLIAHNRHRFPKTIDAASPSDPSPDAVDLVRHPRPDAGARWCAEQLRGRARDEIVVLARTTRLLRTVAEQCAELQIPISAPEGVFREDLTRRVIGAWMRLLADPAAPSPLTSSTSSATHPGGSRRTWPNGSSSDCGRARPGRRPSMASTPPTETASARATCSSCWRR